MSEWGFVGVGFGPSGVMSEWGFVQWGYVSLPAKHMIHGTSPDLFNEATAYAVRKLARSRLKWAGHVERMEVEQLTKRADALGVEGRRRVEEEEDRD